ncbi:MAG: tRNA pseudouridine(55) synthase TruB, partial [Opitutales bacterium]|nr:tRNA pseudouridine(55) synthase TruB [Opitutales bacterium]
MYSSQTLELDGILLIDKPAGITSHDVVDRVRRILRMKRVGHAGTLDPNATGLMIILVGKGTKASQFLMSMDKSYEGTMRFGLVTDSYDIDGEVISDTIPESIEESKILEAMRTFLGDQYQKPPMFSAKKVAGVPLYKHARKGREVEREERLVHIASFTMLENRFPEIDFTPGHNRKRYPTSRSRIPARPMSGTNRGSGSLDPA